MWWLNSHNIMTHPNEEPERKQHARKRANFRSFIITYTEHYDTSGSVTMRDVERVYPSLEMGPFDFLNDALTALSATWDELIDAAPTTTTLS